MPPPHPPKKFGYTLCPGPSGFTRRGQGASAPSDTVLADAAVTPSSPKWPKMCRVGHWTLLNPIKPSRWWHPDESEKFFCGWTLQRVLKKQSVRRRRGWEWRRWLKKVVTFWGRCLKKVVSFLDEKMWKSRREIDRCWKCEQLELMMLWQRVDEWTELQRR